MRGGRYSYCNPTVLLDTVGGDRALFLMMTDIFFRECAAKWSALQQAAAAQDVRAAGRHSHALKGTVGPLAATTLLNLLEQLEADCAVQRRVDPRGLARIQAELKEVVAEVRRFVSTL